MAAHRSAGANGLGFARQSPRAIDQEAILDDEEIRANHLHFILCGCVNGAQQAEDEPHSTSTSHAININRLGSSWHCLYDHLSTTSYRTAWWVDVLNPTEEQIDAVASAFSLVALTVEDIKRRVTCEKWQSLGRYNALYFSHLPQVRDIADARGAHPSTYAIVFPVGVLTFTFHSKLHVRCACGLKHAGDLANINSEWICCALLDHAITQACPLVDKIRLEVDTINAHITEAYHLDLVWMQAYRCRQKTSRLKRFLYGKAIIVNTLLRHSDEFLPSSSYDDSHLYLGYIDHYISELTTNLTKSERLLSQLQLAYLNRAVNRTVSPISRIGLIVFAFTLLNMVFMIGSYLRHGKTLVKDGDGFSPQGA